MMPIKLNVPKWRNVRYKQGQVARTPLDIERMSSSELIAMTCLRTGRPVHAGSLTIPMADQDSVSV